MPKTGKKHRLLFTGIIAVLTAIAFSYLVYAGTLDLWQNRLSDLLYAPISSPTKDITIVTIDGKTLDENRGLGHFTNWNRTYFAKVLKNINKYDPKVVAFDIFFKSSKDPDQDEQFADELAKTDIPILVFRDYPQEGVDEYFFNDSPIEPPNKLFSDLENVTIAANDVLPDDDEVIRRAMPAIFNTNENKIIETIPFSIAGRVLGSTIPSSVNPDFSSSYNDVPLEDGQMLIRYFSSPNSTKQYETFSFLDVFNEQYINADPEQYFKDKIVLVGVSDPYFNDNHFTPVSDTPMPGVEIHANAAQTILDQDFLRNMTPLEKSALITLLAFLSAFIFMFTRIRWSLLFLFAVPAAYAFAAKPLFNAGLIPDMVHPYLVIAVTFVAAYIYRYFTEFKEKSALKGAFSKYVSPAVMDEIMSAPQKLTLGGEKREITVLFTDIAHFTSISEKLSPESLVALLNEYLEAMTDVIMAEGGTIDKYEGDAIMAYFGAPLGQADHAVRACTTALKMREKLTELLNKWKNDPPLPGGEKKPEIDFRCGLSMGEAIVGNVGSKSRLEYTAIGDIVNLGSRLEGANKKYLTNVLVSEATYEAVKEHFEAREIDIIRVVGKAKPIKVYELLNYKGKLVPEAVELLRLYNEGIQMYHERNFEGALTKFTQLLGKYPSDGPSKLYKQRCDVLKDIPPPEDWDGVFELGSK